MNAEEKIQLINSKIEKYKSELNKYKYAKFCIERGEPLNDDDLKFIKHSLEQSGEFIAYQRIGENVWDVSLNPNYEVNESVKRTNDAMVSNIEYQKTIAYKTYTILLISSMVSVLSLVISIKTAKDKTIQKEISKSANSLKQIEKSVEKMSQKEGILVLDTVKVSFKK